MPLFRGLAVHDRWDWSVSYMPWSGLSFAGRATSRSPTILQEDLAAHRLILGFGGRRRSWRGNAATS